MNTVNDSNDDISSNINIMWKMTMTKVLIN